MKLKIKFSPVFLAFTLFTPWPASALDPCKMLLEPRDWNERLFSAVTSNTIALCGTDTKFLKKLGVLTGAKWPFGVASCI